MKKKIKTEDIIYIAGLFDGEGNISIAKTTAKDMVNTKYWLRSTIANTDKSILIYLKNNFGGQLNSNKTAKKKHHKLCWFWTLSCNQSLKFLEEIYPYLRIKKRVVKLAIKFQKDMKRFRFKTISQTEINRRNSISIKIKKLNSVGLEKVV